MIRGVGLGVRGSTAPPDFHKLARPISNRGLCVEVGFYADISGNQDATLNQIFELTFMTLC